MVAHNAYDPSAAEDALAVLGTGNLISSNFVGNNPVWYRKSLEFKVHKTEGYLGESATIHMVLPGEGTQFEQGGTAAWDL